MSQKADRERDVLVLCYHAVSDSWPASLSVTPARLESQLSLLVSRGYRGVTFYEAVSSPATEKTLAVTFDDAYRSILRLAYPVLSSLGLPGTVFVPAAFVGRRDPMRWSGIEQWLGGRHETELTCMSWQELEWLCDAGWEVGSHAQSHPYLTTLDDTSLESELSGSRKLCEERLNRPCRSLAYPYGDVDLRVIAAADRSGYLAAAGLPGRFDTAALLKWPRVGIYHRDSDFRFRIKVSRAVRRLRKSAIWSVVDTVRASRRN